MHPHSLPQYPEDEIKMSNVPTIITLTRQLPGTDSRASIHCTAYTARCRHVVPHTVLSPLFDQV